MLNFYSEERKDEDDNYSININDNLEENALVRTIERLEDNRYVRINENYNNQSNTNILMRENIIRHRERNNCYDENRRPQENQYVQTVEAKIEAYGTFVADGGNVIAILEKFPIKKYAGVAPLGIHLDNINNVVIIERAGIYDVFVSVFVEVGIGAKIELNVNGVGMMHLPPIVAIGQVVGNQIMELNVGDKLTLNSIGIGITLSKGIGASIRLIKIR